MRTIEMEYDFLSSYSFLIFPVNVAAIWYGEHKIKLEFK